MEELLLFDLQQISGCFISSYFMVITDWSHPSAGEYLSPPVGGYCFGWLGPGLLRFHSHTLSMTFVFRFASPCIGSHLHNI